MTYLTPWDACYLYYSNGPTLLGPFIEAIYIIPSGLGRLSFGFSRVDLVSVGRPGSASPIPVHLTPSSRADILGVFDEFLMMGVGRPPLNVRSFRFSRCDVTRQRDMTSDGAM